ncbi:hypothetical protein [Methanotorris formicicus]|uniref:Uncharacterized protein n=1 Tax=Methanotorris formicicus Mc-S-70 TaxID=647171 RepID=H1L0T4_9EURY|nr:hypothetical protein [Methanotorris formicicus]EHP84484.1 hypothetical protein MetfoDRAFT_1658 [Methanotorris formicicus Mc-S-70]
MTVEIKAYDVDYDNNIVKIDGEDVGVLEVGNNIVTTTIITIDGENATKYLSDNSVTIFIDKQGEAIRIDSIKITVDYIPKSNGNYNNGGGNTIKAPIPLGAIILTLITIQIIALKRLN